MSSTSVPRRCCSKVALTIKREENLGGKTFYRLGYPNREVRQSLNDSLLRAMAPEKSLREGRGFRLYQLLLAND